MSLLNALLLLEEGKQVESIEYLQPEMTPRTPFSKDMIVDVRCEETGGRKFIVGSLRGQPPFLLITHQTSKVNKLFERLAPFS